jgi:hypothetical protein
MFGTFLIQVIYLKGDKCDMIVLDPNWLCHDVCGNLFSNEFVKKSKFDGCYLLNEFHLAIPDWDAVDLLPILESLGLASRVLKNTLFMFNEVNFEFLTFLALVLHDIYLVLFKKKLQLIWRFLHRTFCKYVHNCTHNITETKFK